MHKPQVFQFNEQAWGSQAGAEATMDRDPYRGQGHPINPIISTIIVLGLTRGRSKQYHRNESEDGRHSAHAQLEWPSTIVLAQHAAGLGVEDGHGGRVGGDSSEVQ